MFSQSPRTPRPPWLALAALAVGAAPIAVAEDAQPNIYQTAQAAGSFNTLLAAAQAAGMPSTQPTEEDAAPADEEEETPAVGECDTAAPETAPPSGDA